MEDKQQLSGPNRNLAGNIREQASAIFREVVSIRRHLHQHPELSFHEYQTSNFAAEKLREYGIGYKQVAGTGILAMITGKKGKSSRSIALRAELDALPVNEETGLTFKSVNPGVMHACGHDVHTACLLGSAKIIKSLENEFAGSVYLIFQPGEETLPGGAKKMLNENLFAGKEPDLILAQHVLPELNSGEIGVRPGMYMASGDEIYIVVTGEGGHAAMPHTITDTVAAMSQIIVSLQQVTSRFAPPQIPTVLSFGKFTANGATNVIPREVVIEGTFRTMDETWRAKAHEVITSIATSTASGFGAACSVEIRKGYPVLVNDPEKTGLIRKLAGEFIGAGNVKELPLRMTCEDFAWFAGKYPSVFYRLGSGCQDKKLHSPEFDIDEKTMETGIALPAWFALSFLTRSPLVI